MPLDSEILAAIGAAIGSLFCAYFAFKSSNIAQKALGTTKEMFESQQETTKEMFRRQNVIDLHSAWKGVNDIDPNDLNTCDVINAINALDLTALFWNHDIVLKDIMLRSFWRTFKDLYDVLNDCRECVQGKNVTCRDLLHHSPEIAVAYRSMEKDFGKLVKPTTINGG